MNSNCLFCRIASQEIKSDLLYEDEKIVAFRDISPQAATHILIIPKKHYACLNDIPKEEMSIGADLMQKAKELAHNEGIAEKGYRIVMNVNAEGGQTVFHVHLHLIGGQKLSGSMA